MSTHAPSRPVAGVLVLVVGPSGAGKDSLIDAARAAFRDDARMCFARRVVTRDSLAGEDHDRMSPARFDAAEAAGEFALSWRAHGLSYAIPSSIRPRLAAGCVVVANVSRGVILDAERLAGDVVAAHITASPETLLARLRKRGRESSQETEARVARDTPLAASGATIVEIPNDGELAEAASRFIGLLRAVRARAEGRAE